MLRRHLWMAPYTEDPLEHTISPLCPSSYSQLWNPPSFVPWKDTQHICTLIKIISTSVPETGNCLTMTLSTVRLLPLVPWKHTCWYCKEFQDRNLRRLVRLERGSCAEYWTPHWIEWLPVSPRTVLWVELQTINRRSFRFPIREKVPTALGRRLFFKNPPIFIASWIWACVDGRNQSLKRLFCLGWTGYPA